MEGFELCFYFLLFRLSISLSTSVCKRLPGPFLSHTHRLPGFRHPFSSRTARSFSPSWQGQTRLLPPSLPRSHPLQLSLCRLPLTCNKSPETQWLRRYCGHLSQSCDQTRTNGVAPPGGLSCNCSQAVSGGGGVIPSRHCLGHPRWRLRIMSGGPPEVALK